MADFRQGDTTDIALELSRPLDEGMDMKLGIYSVSGEPLFEAYLSDGDVQKVDSTHYALRIRHEMTKGFIGQTSLRVAVFNGDKSLVNAGESALSINWRAEVVTQKLK